MNIFDKVIEILSPERYLRRQAARQALKVLNSGYSNHGASKTKKSLLGWNYKGGSPDDDITDNLDILRQRSRDLYMGAPLATGALKTYRTNVVGFGLRLKAQIDAEFLGMDPEEADEWEKTAEREFALWAKDCDATRMMDFYEMQALVFLSMLMSGDVFCALPMIQRPGNPYLLKISLIEADRVCNPPEITDDKVRGGVEVDQYGAPVAYYIAQKHPLDKYTMGKNKWIRVPAFGEKTGRRNILHIMEFERPGQRRGVPILAPVIETLKQLTRYSEAELMAAVISGMLTVFITSNTPETPLGESIPLEQQIDTADQNSYELGNGAIIALAPGEDVKEVNPNRPNTAFDSFVTSMCRQIGAALEIPHELLIKHFTASYSASRAALLEAWKAFKMRRTWLAAKFCQPIYEEFLIEAVARGRIKAPGFFDDPVIRMAYSGAEWYGPSQGQIDPLKEVNAAALRVKEGFSTRAREAAELTGSDFERIVRQRAREERMMREGGLTGGPTGEEVLAVQSDDNEE
ncbi:phage portal protein [Carboxydothermus islandicus]|uniref:Phage portal protein n=1 Tax=Carboxydothermus islandicus TaxID=661089 RepID=A0A1L8D0W1_9THEO|nr:phage portal protein [Carboxydothermus islandicus]GAV24798.1 phage portal protein [Carboxydothermus islandicus]